MYAHEKMPAEQLKLELMLDNLRYFRVPFHCIEISIWTRIVSYKLFGGSRTTRLVVFLHSERKYQNKSVNLFENTQFEREGSASLLCAIPRISKSPEMSNKQILVLLLHMYSLLGSSVCILGMHFLVDRHFDSRLLCIWCALCDFVYVRYLIVG